MNPVFARKDGAIAADVRVLVDFAPPKERYRPTQEEILRAMNRIMQPDAVAVIGASPEDGKIGNSVMKNLINGGYQGEIYPIHPKVPEVLGKQAYKSVKDIPGQDRRGGVRDSGAAGRRRAQGMRRERDSGRGADSVGLRRDRQRRVAGPDRRGRARI